MADVRVADAVNLPFDDGVFDVDISSTAFGMVLNQAK